MREFSQYTRRMAITDSGTTLPETNVGEFDVVCPECEHTAITEPRRPSIIRRMLGMRPRAAECPVPEYDYSGLSALPCGCRNAAHGS